jgi:hypothetical protein
MIKSFIVDLNEHVMDQISLRNMNGISDKERGRLLQSAMKIISG